MVDETTAEVFSPPYLFKGPRPTITDAPSTMEYGGTISLETPDADRIAKVSLVRMGAVTHSFNMDQRWQELDFRQSGGTLELTAPTSANVAPPGVYYVFIVDDAGVPSEAAIVNLPKPIATTPPADVAVPATDGTAPATDGTAPATGGTSSGGAAASSALRRPLRRLFPGPGARASTAIHGVTATFREAIVTGSLSVHHRSGRASIGEARLVKHKTALRAALRGRVTAGTYKAKLRWLTARGQHGHRTWTFTLR